MNKRSVSMLLVLAMLVSLLSGLTLTASARESNGAPVWDGEEENEDTSEDIDVYFVDETDTESPYVYAYDSAVGYGFLETAEDLAYPGDPMLESEGLEMGGHNYYKITLNTESADTVMFGNGTGEFGLDASAGHTAALPFVDDATRPASDEELEENAFVVYAVKLENGVLTATRQDDVWPAPIQVIQEPTCTEKGKKAYVGLRTGALAGVEMTDALGHAWNEGEVIVAENYLQAGEMKYTCNRCGATKTEEIPRKTNPFEDVAEEDYFFTPVMWAISQDPQVTSGVDATHFAPHNNCTREQIVTFLWAAAGKPEPAGTGNSFTDVKPDAWYYKAVMWAVEHQITAGFPDGSFGVSQSCTRAQAMTFLWASMNRPTPETSESPFFDVKEGDWFYNPILWAAEHQITAGIGDGLFGVDYTCTRCQIMTFLYKTSLLEE